MRDSVVEEPPGLPAATIGRTRKVSGIANARSAINKAATPPPMKMSSQPNCRKNEVISPPATAPTG